MEQQQTFGGGIKPVWIGIVILAVLAWGMIPLPQAARSQTTQMGSANGSMEVVSTTLPSGEQQIVVIDTEKKVLAVYHVEPTQGKVQLRSVRQLAWDLQMEQFNGLSPLPSELRQMRE